MKNLLCVGNDAKTSKGEKLGFLTGILYLAPYNLSGTQLCPMAKIAQCYKACLFTAGRGAFNSVRQARLNKTAMFLERRDEFMRELEHSIAALVRKATREGKIPLVRLNGTSDIRWELIPVGTHANIFEAFPNVQFYDYTKLPNRNVSHIGNYDLTFSYSGARAFAPYAKRAIDAGMRIAVVFRKREQIPQQYLGLPVVPGDKSDVRHLDPKGAIVALYAKGAARKDTTEFVITLQPA